MTMSMRVDAILKLLDVGAHQVRGRLLHRGMSEECIEWVGQEHIKRVMVSTRYDHCHNSHLPFVAGPGCEPRFVGLIVL